MYESPHYQVKSIMDNNPVAIGKRVSMSLVLDIFAKYDLDAFPIVDNEGRLVGIISDHDVLKAFLFHKVPKASQGDNILEHEVSEFMTRNCYTFTPETPLTEVLEKIIKTGKMNFPVVEDGRVVGMFYARDVVKRIKQIMTHKGYQSYYSYHKKEVAAQRNVENIPKLAARIMESRGLLHQEVTFV